MGSFINVLVIRGNTGRSIGGRSACMSCGRQLTAIDLVPVFSYIFLRGACRTCGSRISIQYPLVELVGGSIVLLAYVQAADFVQGLLVGAVGLVLLYLSVYDIRHTIIPSASIGALGALAVVFGAVQVFSGYPAYEYVLQVICGAVVAVLPFAALWFFSGGRAMGFGDVQLAFVLGLFFFVPESVAFVWIAFVLGGVIGAVIVLVHKTLMHTHVLRHVQTVVTMKSEIPFGPFLAVAFFLVALFGIDIVTILGWFAL